MAFCSGRNEAKMNENQSCFQLEPGFLHSQCILRAKKYVIKRILVLPTAQPIRLDLLQVVVPCSFFIFKMSLGL